MKPNIGLEDNMTLEQKETWRLYLKARLDAHEEISKAQSLLTDIDRVLLQIITVLIEEDIPVEEIQWGTWLKKIILMDEMKLTQTAHDKIAEILSDKDNETEIRKEIKDDYVRFVFYPGKNFITRNDLFIDNGHGTCAVEEVTETNWVEPSDGYLEETTRFVVTNGCDGMELEVKP